MGAADREHGRRALRDEFAVAREADKIAAVDNLRQRRCLHRHQRARSAHVHIEPRVGRGHLDIERLARRREHFGNVPRRWECPAERRRKNWAALDRHHVVSLERGKPHLEHVTRAPPGVEYGAAAPLAVGVN